MDYFEKGVRLLRERGLYAGAELLERALKEGEETEIIPSSFNAHDFKARLARGAKDPAELEYLRKLQMAMRARGIWEKIPVSFASSVPGAQIDGDLALDNGVRITVVRNPLHKFDRAPLAYLIQDPGADDSLRSLMRPNFFTTMEAVGIEVDINTSDFGRVGEVLAERRGGRLSSEGSFHYRTGGRHHVRLADYLSQSILNSPLYAEMIDEAS